MLEAIALSAAAMAGPFTDPCLPDAARPACGAPLGSACRELADIPDACGILAEASAMLGPTYEKQKRAGGLAQQRLKNLGYNSQYVAAKFGSFGDLTDVFLVTQPGSQRLFIVITGTESTRDWYENAKFKPYATKWRDGYYYTAPGHAGFRSGTLNLIGALFRQNEFDTEKLNCAARTQSRLARFLCDPANRFDPARQVETILVGHSRGAGIALLSAPAVAGLEIVRPCRPGKDCEADVERQENWPLTLHAVIGYATPLALYARTDQEAGMKNLPKGAPDQWQVYGKNQLDRRIVNIINERDAVPILSVGLGNVIGHRFRIGDKPGAITYNGFGSANVASLVQAHSSAGYCHDVQLALGAETGVCDPRD